MQFVSIQYPSACLGAFCVFWVLGGQAKAQSDVDILITGCRQARDGVRTLDVEFEYHQDRGPQPPPPKNLGEAVQRIKWVQVDKTARWRFGSDFGQINDEYLWKDDKLKILSSQASGGRETSSGTLAPQPRLESQTSSPWLHALFVSLELPHDPIADALGDKKYRVAVAEVERDGRAEKHVTFTDQAGILRKELWIAPSFNYLVTKSVVRHSPDGSGRIERTVSRIKEIKPGIFFPSRGDQLVVKQNIPIIKAITEFKKIRINEPIDPAELELRFPEGLSVTDSVENTRYLVDKNEKPIPGSDKLIPISKDEQIRLEALHPWYHRWTNWAWIGTGVIALFGVLMAFRRLRAR